VVKSTTKTDESLHPARGQSHPARNWLFGGISASALLLAMVGFLLFHKSGEMVKITTSPSEAVINKNGKPLTDKTPVLLFLKAGEHLQIQKRGFEPQEYLHQAGETSAKLELKPIVSEETLRTDPDGASVVMDDVLLEGTTPLTVKKWNQGAPHPLTFTHAARQLSLFTDFEAGEVPNKIYVLLPQDEQRTSGEVTTIDPNAPGTVHFAGDFPVLVKADGKSLGENAKVSLPPGSHKL